MLECLWPGPVDGPLTAIGGQADDWSIKRQISMDIQMTRGIRIPHSSDFYKQNF